MTKAETTSIEKAIGSKGDIVSALQSELGDEKVTTDNATRTLLSKDLSPPDQRSIAAVVVQVTSYEDVTVAMNIAIENGVAVNVRGGGMSYTGGYQPASSDTILLDLSPLNSVVSVSEEDRFMVVDSGCTWQTVATALDGTGLRPVLRGPISGVISTVGGAASQNIPGSMDGVLGVEVVTANGDVIRTGSFGAFDGYGFYRNYGPDLTGLFLGDNGTLGVKIKIALQLETIPAGLAHASYAFDTMQDIAAAMTKISQQRLSGRMFGLDPLKNKTATKVDTREGIDTLKKIATTSQKGLIGGIKDAAKVVAAGKGAYDDVPWSLHVSTEGVDQASAEAVMGVVDGICIEEGRSIEPSIPIAMAAKPFSIRGFLGLKGERWVPLHGIFPFSKVAQAVEETEKFFASHAVALSDNGIIHSFMLSAGDGYYLIEPMFYWPDALLPLHAAALGPDKIKKFGDPQSNPKAQALVSELRTALRDLYFDLGALSAQVGSFYRFGEAVNPTTLSLLKSIKANVDPSGCLSQSNLGLNKGALS